ncbi:strictosidine synthase [Microbaculum marinum]|uniref:Strictosidine synthase n=1 Tax=Microbaculum marinum TaxID=1764581 RepID=A0AAW9RWU6_9HYPH
MGVAEFLKDTVDSFLGGRGKSSITVPVMDGPLQPNDALEHAAVAIEVPGIDNLIARGDGLLVSSGNRVLRVADGQAKVELEFPSEVMSMAVRGDGVLAVGLDGVGLLLCGADGNQKKVEQIDDIRLTCPTAMTFDAAGALHVCNGSATTGARDWPRDLLEIGRSGAVVRMDPETGSGAVLATGLAYPSGICITGTGDVVVSEAWRHRLVRLSSGAAGEPVPVLEDLPAYPGRIARSSAGGYWLAAFAVRSQLQEFVLREHSYRRQMMAEVSPEYWIAPALSSGHSFMEPLQAGGVIRLGIHKPWAPTRSYGLVVELDGDFVPLASAHSRAGGRHHGVTSLVETDGQLLVTAKGAGRLLTLQTNAFRHSLGKAGRRTAP